MKKYAAIVLILLIFLNAMSLTAYSAETGISVEFPEEPVSVYVGRTDVVVLKVSPDGAQYDDLILSVSNAKIAEACFAADQYGGIQITGKAPGKTTVILKSGKTVVAKKEILVEAVLPEQLTVIADQEKPLIGSSGQLTVSYFPEDVTVQKVTWKSSAPRVIKVNADGSYKALSVGTATVTATHANGMQHAVQMEVLPITAKTVTVTSKWNPEKDFVKNNTMTLQVSFLPEDTTDKTVVWSSSDESVATVSNRGVVKAVSHGTAVITATSVYGVSGTYNITVAKTPQKFRITATFSMKSNDHVGSSWSKGLEFGDATVRSGATVSIMPGESVYVGGWVCEDDFKPDYEDYYEMITATPEICAQGYVIEEDISVYENGGRYSGNEAVWHLKIKLTPVN